jgi:hypothetical protein
MPKPEPKGVYSAEDVSDEEQEAEFKNTSESLRRPWLACKIVSDCEPIVHGGQCEKAESPLSASAQ